MPNFISMSNANSLFTVIGSKLKNIRNNFKSTKLKEENYPDFIYKKIWNGLTNFLGFHIWTDGKNIYYSAGASNQYVLDKTSNTWLTKSWTGFNAFFGWSVWSDGDNIYYSSENSQYKLNKVSTKWVEKTWNGLTSFNGLHVWTDGNDIYYSSGNEQYILDKSNDTWTEKTWHGLTSFNGRDVWTDGNNIYYSSGNEQYVLDKSNDTWVEKAWNGLSSFNGHRVWTDNKNIYYSYTTDQYVLDKPSGVWKKKTWKGLTSFNGNDIWTDGLYYYSSNDGNNYKFFENDYSSVEEMTLAQYEALSQEEKNDGKIRFITDVDELGTFTTIVSQALPQNTTTIIDLSSVLPTGKTIDHVLSVKLTGSSSSYVLPYSGSDGLTSTKVTYFDDTTIRIYNGSPNWSAYTIGLCLLLK